MAARAAWVPDQLLAQMQNMGAESILDESGLTGLLKKQLAERMSVREIQGHLLELYGLWVSPDLISTVTDEVLAEIEQWQQRPLEAMYPIVYFDALRLKIRDEGTVKNKAVYWHWVSAPMAARKCWAYGSSKPRSG
ncbi:transposase mutator family protein [Caballeronia humi]|uniref:Mutator family transposase n=1 Tax=Caballeronia humi TaxID=326474 RepID=A0A158I8Y0_9BURK|nr:transposase mutator family protein [Caballeronia humi]